jgi:hypothetical protein
MPSPFPGMNPYIERAAVWADFHRTFLVTLRGALAPQVGPQYFIKIEDHVTVRDADDPDDDQLFVADVAVGREPGGNGSAAPAGAAGAAVGLARPPVTVRLPLPRGRRRTPYLAVTDRDANEVVTVIELLSPANKRPGHDREVFLEKRRQLTYSDANYVELDLLRGHPRLPVLDLPECDYYALVSRPADRPAARLWPVRLRDPLPEIPVPLRPGEPEPVVALQPLLHQVYDSARYERFIYHGDPEPPLGPEDAAWAAGLVPAR